MNKINHGNWIVNAGGTRKQAAKNHEPNETNQNSNNFNKADLNNEQHHDIVGQYE